VLRWVNRINLDSSFFRLPGPQNASVLWTNKGKIAGKGLWTRRYGQPCQDGKISACLTNKQARSRWSGRRKQADAPTARCRPQAVLDELAW
jgi:hypothetical protein